MGLYGYAITGPAIVSKYWAIVAMSLANPVWKTSAMPWMDQ
mgnify:CR=1 FL=1